jgi:3-carboxy-cis,cis-muconate cycloisomerase
VQSAEGLVPPSAAISILSTCKIELFDTEKLARERSRSDGLTTPLVKNLKEMVGIFNPDAVKFVHYGASNQDALNTAMALVTADVLKLIRADLVSCIRSFMALAQSHLHTTMVSRALAQPMSATTFGFVSVNWAAPLVRSVSRLDAACQQALQLYWEGADNTVRQSLADALHLGATEAPCQPQRETWIALGCELALVAASMGKIANDLFQMSQFEIGEVQGLDSLGCSACLNAAQSAPQRLATLLATLPQQHARALSAWQAEQSEWAQLVMSSHDSARSMAQVITRLELDPYRMQANLDAVVSKIEPGAAEKWLGAAQAEMAAGLVARQLELWAPEFSA